MDSNRPRPMLIGARTGSYLESLDPIFDLGDTDSFAQREVEDRRQHIRNHPQCKIEIGVDTRGDGVSGGRAGARALLALQLGEGLHEQQLDLDVLHVRVGNGGSSVADDALELVHRTSLGEEHRELDVPLHLHEECCDARVELRTAPCELDGPLRSTRMGSPEGTAQCCSPGDPNCAWSCPPAAPYRHARALLRRCAARGAGTPRCSSRTGWRYGPSKPIAIWSALVSAALAAA